MSAKASANIRMYRLNELGDCFLITFTAGASSSRLLIDCGSFRNSNNSVARLNTITAEIAKALGGRPLDVVVGTHQHNDHLSGFVHCEKAFRKMKVQEVWLSWLDDPTDKKAQAIGKVHHNLMLQLAAARKTLHGSLKGKSASRPVAARSLEVLGDMLGFHGATDPATPPEIPAKAVGILKSISGKDPRYWRPGRIFDMPGLPAGSVRIYILGPPRVEGVERKDDPLYRPNPREGESYDPALAAAGLYASKFLSALKAGKGADSREEEHYPFNKRYKRQGTARDVALQPILSRYNKHAEAWRKIDDDWMEQAGALGLYLDTYTNNSSLALAIELVDSRKVLLFAADAQTGNWASWNDVNWENSTVKTDDLLARTVFYKVGHHASHNATLVQAFEKMNHPDLVALIPVHKQDPNITKKNGWKMPAKNLFTHLKEKTNHRVLQMDNVNPSDCNPNTNPAKAAWKKVGITPKVTEFCVELDIVG